MLVAATPYMVFFFSRTRRSDDLEIWSVAFGMQGLPKSKRV